MTSRFRKITACLLLTAWPLVLGLATGWHTHSHDVHCGETTTYGHHHAHDGLLDHHGHHDHHQLAAHGHEQSEPQGEGPSRRTPHPSDECHSCQLLALSGVVSQTLPILPSLPTSETTDPVVVIFPELGAPSCIHLRGPPAGLTV